MESRGTDHGQAAISKPGHDPDNGQTAKAHPGVEGVHT